MIIFNIVVLNILQSSYTFIKHTLFWYFYNKTDCHFIYHFIALFELVSTICKTIGYKILSKNIISYTKAFIILDAIMISASSLLFPISLYLQSSKLFLVVWALSCFSSSLLTGLREYIFYFESYKKDLMMVFLKNIKVFGNIPMSFIIFLYLKDHNHISNVSFSFIHLMSVFSILFTIIALILLYRSFKYLKETYKSYHIESTVSPPITIKSLSKIMILNTFVWFFISDQIIYKELSISENAAFYKNFGQAILANILAYKFGDSFYTIAILPIMLCLSYIGFSYKSIMLKKLGVICFSSVMSIYGASGVLMTRLTSKYSSNLLFISNILNDVIRNLSILLYTFLSYYIPEKKIYIIYSFGSFISFIIISIFIYYHQKNNKNIKNNDNKVIMK